MAALGEVHAEHRIARLQERKIYGEVRLRAGMRLHVRMLGAEQLTCAVARNVFHDVDVLAAAVIAVPRIALRVLVRQHRAHRRHNGRRDDVFGGNQLQIAALALELKLHGGAELRVRLGDKADRVQKITVHNKSFPSLNR